MNDMQTSTNHPALIQLDQPQAEPKSIPTRRQEAEERKNDFYKQLEASREPVSANIAPTERRADYIEEDFRNEPEEEIEELASIDNELDNKLIPKKRFDKELEKRKVLEDELRKERDSRIKFETELSLYNKALDSLNQKQQHDTVEQQLDPIDSDAHNFYMNKIKALESKYENQSNNLSEYERNQNFTNTVNYQATEIVKKHPDFNDAYGYLLSVESSKAKMMGYSDEQSMQYALEQIKPYAWQAYNNGGNVAELTYNMAKNYGYKPKRTSSKESLSDPNFDKIDKNMAKSYSALDEIPGVSTSVAPETAAYNTLEGFTRKLTGKNGRGTNLGEFYKAMDKLKNSSAY